MAVRVAQDRCPERHWSLWGRLWKHWVVPGVPQVRRSQTECSSHPGKALGGSPQTKPQSLSSLPFPLPSLPTWLCER